jgi:hypothetical protein
MKMNAPLYHFGNSSFHERRGTMSTRDARKFINDLETDEDLIAKVGELGPALDDEGSGHYYARFAKDLGYDFSAEEYDAGLMQVRAAAKGVIMEQELDELQA